MFSREMYWKRGCVLILVFMLTGCAALRPPDAIDAEKYFREGVGLRTESKGKAPQLGLGLAGGGTKAADFSIGVLQGLTEAGVMERVDAVSTVSGGGYAALWYFARVLNGAEHPGGDFKPLAQRKIAETFFADCLPYVYVAHLRFTLDRDPESIYSGSCPR